MRIIYYIITKCLTVNKIMFNFASFFDLNFKARVHGVPPAEREKEIFHVSNYLLGFLRI